MGNLVVFPIIIPVIIGMIMVVFRKNIRLHRALSLTAVIGVFIISLILMHLNKIEGIQVLQLGGWAAPFGVSMVADMLAAILVMVTSIVALCCLLYAFNSIGKERELLDRKSTRLNSSHVKISYAVFCL